MVNAKRRPIRSFVLRQGRISPAQERACESLLPRYGIHYSTSQIDLAQAFGRAAPKFLEIGFGMGETSAYIAQMHPENDYLCVDVHTPGVGSLLRQLERLELTNVRVIQHDAVEVLKTMLAPKTLAGVHIFFPDPWPKKRHHKRRLIQPDFMSLLCDRLQAGGYVHAATDWQDYAEQMLTVLSAQTSLVNTAIDYARKPSYRPTTKFEQRGLKLAHQVWDLVFVKQG